MIAVMVTIFVFSQQQGSVSGGMSNDFAGSLGITPDGEYTPSEKPLILGLSLRKLAHVGLFFGLGVSVTLFFVSLVIRRDVQDYVFAGALSFLTSFVYALSDELHQYFVPGRNFHFYDVAIDAIGFTIAIPAVLVTWYLLARLRARKA